jgi:hypothetical protein
MTAKMLKELYKKLLWNIEFIITRFVIYYNFKKIKESIFKERNIVYLLRKNIKIKKSSLKLDYIKLDLYLIKKVLKKMTYEL